ncbi:hypothetical protein Vadar_026076 [Vaccinium darrowii]|uniref:Uncharacterized protein n=1 Tax=Vaccinium darrowii TaxID=229202 RepID=A0ACB7YH91_9ERIC|nr:hypothetical protein Vadar_026076 [Vaccinium darrowii]
MKSGGLRICWMRFRMKLFVSLLRLKTIRRTRLLRLNFLLPIVETGFRTPFGNPAISHRLINQSCAQCYKATATTAALAKKYGADVTVIVIDEKQKESLAEDDIQLPGIRWHLSEASTAALEKKYGADITVVGKQAIEIWQKMNGDQRKEQELKDRNEFPKRKTNQRLKTWDHGVYPLKSWDRDTVFGGLQGFKLLERLGEGKKPTAIIGEIADDISLDLVVMSMEAIHSKLVDANLLAKFIHWPLPRSTFATVEYCLRPVWLQFQMFF